MKSELLYYDFCEASSELFVNCCSSVFLKPAWSLWLCGTINLETLTSHPKMGGNLWDSIQRWGRIISGTDCILHTYSSKCSINAECAARENKIYPDLLDLCWEVANHFLRQIRKKKYWLISSLCVRNGLHNSDSVMLVQKFLTGKGFWTTFGGGKRYTVSSC